MSVDTFVDSALDFTERHRNLDAQQASFGGLLWGAMRAIAECPDCPGRFRVPVEPDPEHPGYWRVIRDALKGPWAHLYCFACQKGWHFTEPTNDEGRRR